MSKEKETKYLIQLHLIEIKVDKDSKTEDYWEYEEEEVEIEPLNSFDDYDEAQEVFDNYVKQLT